MTPFLILDTGPIVAYLDPTDPFHEWVEERFRLASAAFLSCEAVLSEAAFLLSRPRFGVDALLEFVNAAPVNFPFSYSQNRFEIQNLVTRYGNVPMSIADACLVRLSELYPDAPILTLDSDFLIYRRNKNESLPVILPKERLP